MQENEILGGWSTLRANDRGMEDQSIIFTSGNVGYCEYSHVDLNYVCMFTYRVITGFEIELTYICQKSISEKLEIVTEPLEEKEIIRFQIFGDVADTDFPEDFNGNKMGRYLSPDEANAYNPDLELGKQITLMRNAAN